MGKIGKISDYQLEDFVEKILTTKDSVKILSWYKKPTKSEKKIILYFHGNAGNLGDRAHKLSIFAKRGFGILAISYRGYSGSEGKAFQDGLVRDADAALEFLLSEGYEPKNILLYGESLGSGVAMQIAPRFSFAAIILESPFSSVESVASSTYWFMPVKLLLKDKFDSAKIASTILTPILIIHGTADRIVSFKEGRKLYKAIISPKRFIKVEDADHLGFEPEFLLEEIVSFLSRT